VPALRLVPCTPTLALTGCIPQATAGMMRALRGLKRLRTPSARSAREEEDDRCLHWGFSTGFGRTGVFRAGLFFQLLLLRAPRVTVLLQYSFKQTKIFSSVVLLYNM